MVAKLTNFTSLGLLVPLEALSIHCSSTLFRTSDFLIAIRTCPPALHAARHSTHYDSWSRGSNYILAVGSCDARRPSSAWATSTMSTTWQAAAHASWKIPQAGLSASVFQVPVNMGPFPGMNKIPIEEDKPEFGKIKPTRWGPRDASAESAGGPASQLAIRHPPLRSVVVNIVDCKLKLRPQWSWI
jgi:hypothetical protein